MIPRGGALRFRRMRIHVLVLPLLSACTYLPARDFDRGDIQQQSDAIVREVSRVRDLELKQPVPAAKKDRDSLKEALLQETEEEWTELDDKNERAMKAFGLLPADLELKRYEVDLMKEQIAGYYDPRKKEFFSIDRSSGSTKEKDEDDTGSRFAEVHTLTHELSHAIEDQHFDLEATRKPHEADEDASLAVLSLVEGSAEESGWDSELSLYGWPLSTTGPILRSVIGVYTELNELLEELVDDDDIDPALKQSLEALHSAPPILSTTLQFPYTRGFTFVNRVRSEFGWEAVDAMYRDPPESSEQILYPERYFDRRDRPVAIAPASPPFDWKEVHQNTLGMLGMQILLLAFGGEHAAARAEGWDGDRYVLWQAGDRDVVGWVTVWDEEGQAEDFAETYESILRHRADVGGFAVKQADNRVIAVWNAPGDTADAAATKLQDSVLTVAPDDQAPDSHFVDWFPLPLKVQLFDRAWRFSILGGWIFDLRSHDDGHHFDLVHGLAIEQENNADRTSFWTALGLIGFNHDRTLDLDFSRIPLVYTWHSRGEGDQHRKRFDLLPFSLIQYRNDFGAKSFDFLWGIVCSARWGTQPPDEPGLRVLFVPIPGT